MVSVRVKKEVPNVKLEGWVRQMPKDPGKIEQGSIGQEENTQGDGLGVKERMRHSKSRNPESPELTR